MIDIGESIINEPLVRQINEDESWPKNIYEYLKEMQPDRSDRYEIYFELMRKNIVDNNLFSSFKGIMEQFGCRITLQEYFIDGLFLSESQNISKQYLIIKGVFTKEEAKKDFYPAFKSGISFDLHCADDSQESTIQE
ncbi:hypothetical protein [Desulfatibacillum alkenivorans]|uniref:hypothetical protein n=1 Tax=Desulfatibacillum alkenivorans TaxID=259354 RepID=UPI000935E3D9|nr:hypothetical protein [Desulfatibacillum alkenivorans]